MLTLDQALVFAILSGTMALFVWNRLRYDLVALLSLLTAMATGIVPADKAFAGFGDQVVVIVASVLVLSAAGGKSGMIGRLIRRIEPSTTVAVRIFGVYASTMFYRRSIFRAAAGGDPIQAICINIQPPINLPDYRNCSASQNLWCLNQNRSNKELICLAILRSSAKVGFEWTRPANR